MGSPVTALRAAVLAITLAWAVAAGPALADVSSWARVQDDGSLSIGGRLVRLQGLFIPPTDRICGAPDMPTACGPRAVLQLASKIGAEFVHCRDLGSDATGVMLGRCTVVGEDLGSWMVINGWAMAGPDAPIEYLQLERLAESRRIGIWGQPVDIIVRPPRRSPPPVTGRPPAKPGS